MGYIAGIFAGAFGAVLSDHVREANTLFKLKEIWVYLGEYFLARNPAAEKLLKKIRKAKSVSEYSIAVAALFQGCM